MAVTPVRSFKYTAHIESSTYKRLHKVCISLNYGTEGGGTGGGGGDNDREVDICSRHAFVLLFNLSFHCSAELTLQRALTELAKAQ